MNVVSMPNRDQPFEPLGTAGFPSGGPGGGPGYVPQQQTPAAPPPRGFAGARPAGAPAPPAQPGPAPAGGGSGFVLGGPAPRRRVVIGDESVELCHDASKVLDEMCACDTVAIASTPRETVEKALVMRPDIVILSETCGSDAAEVIRHLRQSLPVAGLVYIQAERDERAAREIAYNTGAVVLCKPLYSNTLVEAVNRLTAPAGAGGGSAAITPGPAPNLGPTPEQTRYAPPYGYAPPPETAYRVAPPPVINAPVVRQQLVAVVSAGGGGKSTVAAEMCAFIALRNTVDIRPLLWDCNIFHGHQRLNLSIKTTKSVLELLPYLDGSVITENILSGAVVNYELGHGRFMDVLLAPPVPQKLVQAARGMAEVNMVGSNLNDDVMENIAGALRRFYTIIVADMSQDPHSDQNTAILEMADKIIMVIPIDDVARIADMLNIYQFFEQGLGLKMDKVLLAVNFYTRDYDREIKELVNTFGREVAAILPFDPNVRRMRKEGRILSVTKATPFVFGIEELAKKICPTPEIRRGPFSGRRPAPGPGTWKNGGGMFGLFGRKY